MYGRATPRAWLDPVKTVRVERLQTRFGPTSFSLTADRDRITGFIERSLRYQPSAARLRLRRNGQVTSLELNGRPTPRDATGAATLPAAERIEIVATVTR